MPTNLPKRPKAGFTAARTVFGSILGALALAVPALAASVLVASVLVAGPAGAGSPAPACGSTVTTNLTLTADLSCPSGDGLVVGAAGITIDLGGHTLNGAAGGIGISNPSFATVTIRNGAITGFGTAVQVTSAPGNVIATLHVTIAAESTTGILLDAADRAQVQDNVLSGGVNAILLRADPNDPSNRAEANVVFRNTISGSEEAIAIVGSNDNHLINNTVTGAATAFRIAGGSGGNDVTNNRASVGTTGLVVDSSNNSSNTVGGNTFFMYETTGISIEPGPSTTQVIGNQTFRNGVGIFAEAAGTSLGGNTADDNSVRGMIGLAGVDDLGANRASGNPDPQCVNIRCTGSPAAAHPDATIRTPGGEILGRHVLDPAGEGQTKHVGALPNGPGQVVVRVHNDHDVAAVFAVSAPESGSQGFRTRFHAHGTDVTRAVRAGTFVASVEPEGVMVLHLTVKARAGTAPGSTGSYFLTVSNLHAGERVDAVKVHERAV